MNLTLSQPARKIGRAVAESPLQGGALRSLFEQRPAEVLEPNAVVFWEGDIALDVFQVVSGCLRLYRLMADGRRAVTGFMFAGEILGVSFKDRYLFTAEAVTRVRLRRFPRAQMHESLARLPKLSRELLAVACDELSAAQDQMLLLGRKTALERIAHFLLAVAKRTVPDDRLGCDIELPMSRLDIADFLGLTIETVCRVLTKLRTEGLIAQPSPHRLSLVRMDELRRVAAEAEGSLATAPAAQTTIRKAVWPS